MLTLLIATAAVAQPQPARNWTQTVASTPVGWRVGNPAARIKLVEYGSLNCPHCAHYSEFATAPIMAAVEAGRASFEFRPFLIFPHDVAATLIARCVAPGRRFGFIERYYKATGGFTDKLRASDPASLKAEGTAATNRRLVAVSGMAPLAARFGLTPAATNRCVSDPAGAAWLQAAYAKAKEAGVQSTPTFLINGKRVEFNNAAELSALLK
ncbi:MAG TPA: thioredoxin domain-containing protein [Sphingomicrobium sp.]|nr:thioredoxin domain-containing protein [Sphingomicrobium sp.]